jgi:phosphoenolpyruvate---glycerone phosphotransferase subunit DhaL
VLLRNTGINKMILIKDVIQAIQKASDNVQTHAKYLNDLDAVVGDGEHGVNLARAFRRVLDKLPELPDDNFGNLLKGVGRELISAGGGAGTTFYGAAFLAAGKVAGTTTEITGSLLAEMFSAALEDICKRGSARAGDKTMIDALEPAVGSFKQSLSDECDLKDALQSAAVGAKAGALETKKMLGKKGRSFYAGERALGTPDPGAASVYLIFSAFAGIEPEIPL